MRFQQFVFGLAVAMSSSCCAAATIPSSSSHFDGLLAPRSPVVGGKEAKAGEVPFMVAIETRREGVICGGSLLSPTTVLTLGSCATRHKLGDIFVRAGAQGFEGSSHTLQGGVPRTVKDVKRSPDGKAALLVLESKLSESQSTIGYAELAGEEPKPESRVYAFGWGSRPEARSLHLTKGSFSVMYRTKCEDFMGRNINTDIFCLMSKWVGVGLYDSDTGGPLVDINNRLVGISYMYPNQHVNVAPFLGVRVGPLVAWIQQEVNDLPPRSTASKPSQFASLIPSRGKGKGYVRLSGRSAE